MKKLLCLILLMLCTLPAGYAADDRDAAWFSPVLHAPESRMHLLSADQLAQIAALPSKDIHAIVEALFQAAAGVEERAELELWKTLNGDAKTARSAENTAYRAVVKPWLTAVLAPGNRNESASALQPETSGSALPTLSIEDSYEALCSNESGQAYLALIAPLGGTDADSCLAVTQAAFQRWLAELDHSALSEINSDYQLWMYAPATPIDYPVVQCGNNRYYMDRMFNRRSNPAGTLFIDYRNLPGFQDPNTLIYGHHMRDSSMFHSLTDYDAEGFFDAHPYMLFISPDRIDLLEVFAGYVTDGSDHCYNIAISAEEDMARFVEKAKKKSLFDAHIEVNYRSDHLVTLSTCTYQFDGALFVVIGRLNPIWSD